MRVYYYGKLIKGNAIIPPPSIPMYATQELAEFERLDYLQANPQLDANEIAVITATVLGEKDVPRFQGSTAFPGTEVANAWWESVK